MRAVTIAVVLCLFIEPRPYYAEGAATETPALAILELAGAKEIKWADVKTPDVDLPLTIENVEKTRLTKVIVETTSFSGPGGTVAVQLNGKPSPLTIETIAPGDRATAKISAKLPAPGTYRALISLRNGGKIVLSATIEIARVRSQAPIEIAVVPAQIVDLDVWRTRESRTFTTRVKGTGQKVELDPPTLQSSEYKEKIDSKVSVGAPLVTVTFAPSTGFSIDAAPVSVTTTIADIDTPGRYDLVVALGGQAYAPTTASLTFYARQSVCVASGSILVGVLLSLFLRYYSIVGRPTLVNKQRANRLFRELDEHAALARDNEHALSLVQDLRRKLAESWDGLSRAGKLRDAPTLDAYEAKIAAFPQWLQLWRRVARVSPATVAAPFQTQLVAVEAVLRDRNAELSAVNTQTVTLDGMAGAIDSAMAKELRNQIETLGPRLREDARFQGLAAELEKIAADVPQNATGVSGARLEAVAEGLDAIQRQYFVLVVGDLAPRLGTDPIGVGPKWQATVEVINANIRRVRDASRAADASAAFRSALTLYLRTVLEGLLADIAIRIAHKSQFKDRYAAVSTRLEAIGPLVDHGQVVEAWKKLDQAQVIYRQIREEASPGSMGAGAAALDALSTLGSVPAAAAEVDLATIALGGSSADAVARSGAGSALGRWRHAGDIVSNALILIAAVLIGVQALWVGNPTWGGWPSMLAAFLWGLTFDQLSHAGLVTLLKRG